MPIQQRYCFEAVYRLLVDLRGTEEDVLFGSGFAQILPVVPKGMEGDIVYA